MFQFSYDLWQVFLRSAIIYVIVLLGLRLMGKREIGQLTPYDFVLLLLISNAVQNAMTGPDTTIWGGLIAASTLFLMNWLITIVVARHRTLRKVIEGQPTILISQGKLLETNLKKEKVGQEEIEMAAREHGIEHLKDVELAILETDGSISIIPFTQDRIRVKRKLKAMRHR